MFLEGDILGDDGSHIGVDLVVDFIDGVLLKLENDLFIILELDGHITLVYIIHYAYLIYYIFHQTSEFFVNLDAF